MIQYSIFTTSQGPRVDLKINGDTTALNANDLYSAVELLQEIIKHLSEAEQSWASKKK